MLMFGTYSVINIVVLMNLLIAMMNHSYQLISVSVLRFGVEYFLTKLFFTGTRWYGVEVCAFKALDKLLWRRRDLSAPIQHHTNPKVPCLCVPMGEKSLLQWIFRSQKGASANNQSRFWSSDANMILITHSSSANNNKRMIGTTSTHRLCET